MTVLNEPMNIDIEDEQHDIEEPLTITTDLEAENHLRHLAHWRLEQQKIRDHANAQIEKIRDWEAIQLKKTGNRIRWHEGGLRGFLYHTGKKTLKLVNGILKKRAGSKSIVIEDPKAFCESALEEFVTTTITKSPSKKAIMAHFKESGEIIDGTDVITGDDSYTFDTV
jgi:hypothetical protein